MIKTFEFIEGLNYNSVLSARGYYAQLWGYYAHFSRLSKFLQKLINVFKKSEHTFKVQLY